MVGEETIWDLEIKWENFNLGGQYGEADKIAGKSAKHWSDSCPECILF